MTCDEHIFWGFMRNQSGGGHLCARKPRGFGPEYKCLSAVGINVTTTFEHVRNAKHNKTRKYTKEYGAGAACVLRLCEASGIQGSERIVVCDSWFEGIRLPLGLRKIGLHSISMIKTCSSGYCKDELKDKLMVMILNVVPIQLQLQQLMESS